MRVCTSLLKLILTLHTHTHTHKHTHTGEKTTNKLKWRLKFTRGAADWGKKKRPAQALQQPSRETAHATSGIVFGKLFIFLFLFFCRSVSHLVRDQMIGAGVDLAPVFLYPFLIFKV